MIAWCLRHPTPTIEGLVQIPREVKFLPSYRNEIGVKKQRGVGSRGYVMVTSASSCRTAEVEGVGTAILPRVSAQSTWWIDTTECRDMVG